MLIEDCSINNDVLGYAVGSLFNVVGVLRAPVKVGQFSRILSLSKPSNQLRMAVTVNALAQNVQSTQPVHIVISEICSHRPFV